MIKNQRLLWIVGGFGAMLITLALSNGKSALAEMKPLLVQIVNSSSNPVSVIGKMTVEGIIQVQQSGEWTVNIAGNSQANPLFFQNINESAQNSYKESAVGSFNQGAYVAGIFFNEVPAGKRLVIQSLSLVQRFRKVRLPGRF